MKFPQKTTELFKIIGDVLNYKLFDLNKTPITVLSILMFALMLLAFFIISRILNRVILRKILERFGIESGIRFNLIRISHYVVMIVGTIVAFQFVGINLSGLAVIFGLLSVGIGFGLQNITSNFISGLILLFERPIKVGDRVTIGDTIGDVISINMRSTTVKSLNNIAIIVPNSEFISSKVTNWSYGDPSIRLDLAVGVSYESDIDAVLKALKEVADAHRDVLQIPKPDILLSDFGDSSWNMLLRVWLRSPDRYYNIRSELNIAIVRKFREYGIEIPFPQRDLHVRSPLPMPFESRAASS